MGHRNPQGITKMKDVIFSVEHGPRGGDELNIIKKNQKWYVSSTMRGSRYGRTVNVQISIKYT